MKKKKKNYNFYVHQNSNELKLVNATMGSDVQKIVQSGL